MKKVITIIGILFIILALIVIFTGCKIKQEKITDVDRSSVEIIFDNELIVGDIKWVLLEAKELGSIIENEYGEVFASHGGRFIYISFTAENLGNNIKQIFDMKVVDDKGNYYSVCADAYGYLSSPEVCLVQDLNPGQKREFNASFDIPIDSIDLILELTDLEVPTGEKGYIDLGL